MGIVGFVSLSLFLMLAISPLFFLLRCVRFHTNEKFVAGGVVSDAVG